MTGAARDTSPGDAATRLADIRSRIAKAAREAGRNPQDVTLIAVSKTFGEDGILPLIEAGQRAFGENRVQEAAAKWPGLRARIPGIELHLIGPLQTNKLDEALALFDVFHTLDREKLALALIKARDKGKTMPRLFVQVNTGEEPQKAGVLPEEADLPGLLALEALFPGDRLSRRGYRRHLASPRAWLGVLEEGGELRGSALCLFRAGSRTGRLYSLIVDPAQRGRGLARALLAAAEAAASARGCRCMRLEVRADNAAALALYAAAAYAPVRRLPAYYDDGCDGVRLEKRLP